MILELNYTLLYGGTKMHRVMGMINWISGRYFEARL